MAGFNDYFLSHLNIFVKCPGLKKKFDETFSSKSSRLGTTEGSGDFNLEGSGGDVKQPNEGNLSSIFSRVPSCDRYLETSSWQYNWDYNDYFWIEGRLFVVALVRRPKT